ncbi:Uncharacterised protein [uncultured archaeon]|nr:Uncharacterised protein [uncultured archaeon]
MFNQKEVGVVILVTIILALIISSVQTWDKFLYLLPVVFLVIAVNVIAKKVASFYLDSEVEIKLWEIERYGFKSHHRFNKAIPAGVIMPILLKVLSFGYLNWLAVTSFDVKPKTYRAAKRFGLYSFSEVSEFHIGIIAAAGVVANLFFAIVAYLLNIPDFARISIFYTFFNMIPISDLDGNKIFFGSLILWAFLASLVVIGMFFALFVI